MQETMQLHQAIGAMRDRVSGFFRDAAERAAPRVSHTYRRIAAMVERSADEVLAPCCAAVAPALLNQAFEKAAEEMPMMMAALRGTEGFRVPDSDAEIALLAVSIKAECIGFLSQLARVTEEPALRASVNQCIVRETAHKHELIALVNSYRR